MPTVLNLGSCCCREKLGCLAGAHLCVCWRLGTHIVTTHTYLPAAPLPRHHVSSPDERKPWVVSGPRTQGLKAQGSAFGLPAGARQPSMQVGRQKVIMA